MKLPATLILLLAAAWLPPAYTADIQVLNDCAQGYCIRMNGKIMRGDHDKIISIILYKKDLPELIYITSPGGDVIEAIKLGKVIRRGLIRVIPSGSCNSACAFLVFASAEHRKLDHRIGLHRPYYEQVYFAGLSFEEAKEKYAELDLLVASYLNKMGVPTIISEKIMSISSSSVEYVSLGDYIDVAGPRPPAYDEWLIAQCGAMSTKEATDLNLVDSYVFYFSPQRKGKGTEWFNKLKDEYKEEAMKAKDFSPEYMDYLVNKKIEINDCQQKAIEKEQKKYAQGIIKEYENKGFAKRFVKYFDEFAENRAKAKDAADEEEIRIFIESIEPPSIKNDPRLPGR